MFYSVALLSPPYSILTYTAPAYLPSAAWRTGMRVLAPLGQGMVRVGLLTTAGQPESGLREGVNVRNMLWPLETMPLCSARYVHFVAQLAARQMTTPGRILGTVMPVGLRGGKMRLQADASTGRPKLFTPRDLMRMSESELFDLGVLWMDGSARWLASRADAAESELCVLQQEPPWTVRPTATRQMALLELLFERGALSRREVLRAGGAGSGVALDAVIKAGLVKVRSANADDEIPPTDAALLPPAAPAFTLNLPQQDALKGFCAALDSGKASTGLLHGVTGSGKTAVYLELIKACLQRGRNAFLLAPEVALAHKLLRDARLALGENTLIWMFHGYQSAASRERTFAMAHESTAQAKPCVVVGTRSALFLPLEDVGLIVLDEEHDASFKQDEGLTYQAKELAWFRAEQDGALLLLGSATPDLKTFKAAQDGTISLASLPQRAGAGTPPEICLVDIRQADLSESLFAPETLSALVETVRAGEQAVILLNRRGYAPLMYCLDCGKTARCPHCDIGLTYHKGRERLVCHYCGYTLPFPAVCPSCKGLHYHPMGQGTERLEEYLVSLLPAGTGILRLDRDSTRCPGRMEAILEDFAAQKAQVLVGTQMLSKGHHFPHVTLAIIADADMGLNMPDYRAAERTFQLLVQSAGRAGRGEKPGRVLIQTRAVEHYCWKFVREGDYEGFYNNEIALRSKYRYPPFGRLGLLRFSYPADWADGEACMAVLTEAVRKAGRECKVTVRGPAPAPFPLLRGRRRFHCLLKADDWAAIRGVAGALHNLKMSPHVRISLDMDPVNMM